ncbi:MAG: OB-fold domain-containing protein [Jatrophihabitans sp.]
MTVVEPLSAPIELSFAYTRSLGATLGPFMTGLARRQITGVRVSDGRVVVPPLEYDPHTGAACTDIVEVADEGVVESWTWAEQPLPGQPLTTAFGWALIRLDGADTSMLHAVEVSTSADMSVGMRVRAVWADAPVGHIRDIVCFRPSDVAPEQQPAPAAADPVTLITTPISMSVVHSASYQETQYLLGLERGRILGQRCPQCEKVYVPPRGACPVDGVPTRDEVELPDRGIVTTFCIVNVPFYGQKIAPPYVCAYVLLDGADIAFLHLVLDCDAADVRMGMRVQAVWKPREEWEPSLQNITHFRPTGEPDADYDSFKEHL